MFTKEQEIGRGQYRVTETVTDWGAVIAAIFWIFIVLIILGKCTG